MKLCLSIIFSLLAVLLSCTVAGGEEKVVSPPDHEAFGNYWYQGKGELTRYELKQARYGEIHEGEAVLIFVTEDFLPDQQVKYEYGSRPNNIASVLKLNATRKFFTGIYPYSIMTSVFTPIQNAGSGETFKVTSSSQEWCGHTYMQANLREDRYKGFLHSYFQAEVEMNFDLPNVLLEDAVWTQLRIDPSSLPRGDVKVIPAFHHLRLRHLPMKAENARISVSEIVDEKLSDQPLNVYRIEYQSIERTLEIKYEQEFPYTIVAWSEEISSGFGGAKTLKTTAVRTHSLNSPYWSQHDVADSTLRDELGLEYK